jgi:uncharacterized membrane protein
MNPTRSRLAFVDGARALAMLLMLQGHSADNLLVEATRATPFFELYWKLRGVTAPLFLTLSGLALVLASEARWEEYGRPGRPLARRLWRAAALLLVGTLLQVPRWTGRAPFDFTAADWRCVLRPGVLQIIALSVASAHVLIALARGRRAFAACSFALGALAFAAAPVLAQPWARLPSGLALLLTFDSGSFFPLVPWLGYFFFGLVVGRLFLDRPSHLCAPRFWAALAAAGAALFWAGLFWDRVQPDPFVGRAHWVSAPSLFLMRMGGAWLVVAAFALALGERRSPRWLRFVSARALSIYVAHLVVLYGPPGHFELGLIARVGASVPAGRIFLVGPLLFAVCALAVYLPSRVRRALAGAGWAHGRVPAAGEGRSELASSASTASVRPERGGGHQRRVRRAPAAALDAREER